MTDHEEPAVRQCRCGQSYAPFIQTDAEIDAKRYDGAAAWLHPPNCWECMNRPARVGPPMRNPANGKMQIPIGFRSRFGKLVPVFRIPIGTCKCGAIFRPHSLTQLHDVKLCDICREAVAHAPRRADVRATLNKKSGEGTCRTCGEPIFWRISKKSKPYPAVPDANSDNRHLCA